MSEILSEFENEFNDPANIGDDAAALPAEILNETRFFVEPKEEVLNERLTELLKNLPQEAETKFIVTRLADKNLSGQFRIPCFHNEECDAIYWNGDSEPSELYAQVRKINGGGLYRFRTHAKGAYVKNGTWTQIIADGELSEKEKIIESLKKKEVEAVKAETVQPTFSPQPQNKNDDPFETFLMQFERLEKFKSAIAPPVAPAPEAPAPQPVTKESIKMAVVEKCLNEPELLKIALRSVFDIPAEVSTEPEEQSTIIEVIKYIAAHPGESKTVLDTVLGSAAGIIAPLASLVMPKQPTQPTGLDAFRKTQNELTPVSIPQTQPTPPQSAQFEPFIIEDTLPFFETGENKNV